MTNAGATTTGLAEVRAGVSRLPAVVTERLRKVARDTALRVKAGARARVRKDTRITEQSIDVYPRPEQRQYRVGVFASPPHVRQGKRTTRTAYLPNLALWIEMGTIKKPASPFLAPAAEAEDARYQRDAADAALGAAAEVFTK